MTFQHWSQSAHGSWQFFSGLFLGFNTSTSFFTGGLKIKLAFMQTEMVQFPCAPLWLCILELDPLQWEDFFSPTFP